MTVGQVHEKTIGYCIEINTGSRYHHSALARTAQVKKSADQRKLEKEMSGLSDQIEHSQKLAIEVRKRISQLSSLERQAKASIAESILNQTKQGRAFLDSIDGVKSLPMPTDIG